MLKEHKGMKERRFRLSKFRLEWGHYLYLVEETGRVVSCTWIWEDNDEEMNHKRS
jgi:hypothetical protein